MKQRSMIERIFSPKLLSSPRQFAVCYKFDINEKDTLGADGRFRNTDRVIPDLVFFD